MSRALVLAASPDWAESAATWVVGDAVVHIGDPRDDEVGLLAAASGFDEVVVSGDVGDVEWISSAFGVADRVLKPGCRVTVVFIDTANEATAAAPRPASLSDDVAAQWRLAAMVVEHPRTAVSFARAADTDGAATTLLLFGHAQNVSYLYRHPELAPELQPNLAAALEAQEADAHPDDDQDELVRLRRDLAAYRGSKLGRVTTAYWKLRRRSRRS